METYQTLAIDGEEVLDAFEICRILRIGMEKLNLLIKDDILPPSFIVARKNFWKRSTVEEYLEQQNDKNE